MVSYRSERIKAALDIERVVGFYGYEPNRQGFVSCPFHNERTASLKIYPNSNSFYCFGCGAGGDVIDCVRLLYGLDFGQACLRLESDFGLVGGQSAASPELSERAKKRNAEKAEYKALEDRFVLYNQIIRDCKPKAQGEPPSPEFIEAIKEKPHIENRLRELEEKWK